MDTEEFRVRGKEMVDYICTYMTTIRSRRVTPSVEPGYLRAALPSSAPEYPESWDDVMCDVENKIMPGLTHWQHPRFHAYFPSGNGYPSILGDMLSAGIACIGFSWAAAPANTELEIIMLDWMGKAIGLPPAFLALEEGSKGGGVIEGSASECVLVCMLAARANGIKRLKHQFPTVDEGLLLSKLIAYCSKEAHSCVEKAAMICFVKMRILEPDEQGALRGETLKQAMEEDEEAGLVPFFVGTTLGTTSSCSFDVLTEIGPVVRKFPSVWLHVDAAYAGSAFLCPEHKYHLAGVEYADSFNTNPNKLMLTNFDCSLLWVTNRYLLTSALVVDPLYLQHCYDHTAIDYRHWGVPLSRRFRSLKLWFMLRSYGITGLQKYVRRHCELAKYFEQLVKKDERFQVCNQVKLGLVCFRLVGGPDETGEQVDELNKKLLTNINASGKIHMVPASVRDRFVIRFCVVYQHATREDIEIAWDIITEFATELLEGPDKERDLNEERARRHRAALAHKRSFFVRMVSDPKIYNPAINKTPPPVPTTPGSPPAAAVAAPVTPDTPSDAGGALPTTPKQSSWISWPLAFFFQSVDNDNNDLPLRFRHLDTMVRLKSPGQPGRRGSSPSPSPERRAPSPSAH
ncbi:PREDICTED: tyrosine decarboxylase [Papilio xuthus]|uniref:Aromatic-L-amino-acid decarboxylase n=1 Tax=Papilio xuthus TaxID=66420 RepID=A0A194Q8T4_PAPXU|nr:PREDICTED: tyrosine decarboxylase [Papilio xuthus]XP_013182049.1 PREDICTED: tyrosine decarboxylase [Papilio xuthus]KPJ01814.1 Aromatic-L-amino-acid decarboxylase [Papilio xuthus]